MLRRGVKCFITCKQSSRCFSQENIKANLDRFFAKNVAYESDYYYRQDKKLLELLRKKTEEEVKMMQNKVRSMKHKIKAYNQDISETVRFLEGLERDMEIKNTKKPNQS